jgi:hypothetical protein
MTKVRKMGVVDGGRDAEELNGFIRGAMIEGRT